MEKKRLYRDRDLLYQKYWQENLSTVEIANIYKVYPSTILCWMKKLSIKRRTLNEALNIKDKLYNHKSWLIQKYLKEKLSMPEIGKICGVAVTQIQYWLIKYGIKRRNRIECRREEIRKRFSGDPLYWNKNWLYQKYINEKLSSTEIGKICKTNSSRIYKYLKRHGIKIRSLREWHQEHPDFIRGKNSFWWGKHHSKEVKEKISKASKGENNGHWLGGISFEPYGIEFNKELKERIRKRDDYTCQMLDCNVIQNGKKFPIHHTDYIKTNNEDWNLITLCHSCHPRTNTNREYWEDYFKENIICPK